MTDVDFLKAPVSFETVCRILGITMETPLTVDDMSQKLSITTFINPGISKKLEKFVDELLEAFKACGVEVIDYENALNKKGKIKEDVTILYPISKDSKEIAIDHVSSLYRNPVIGIYDEDPPLETSASNQEKLDTIVKYLTEEITHLAIFLGEKKWTIYTMNGGVVNYDYDTSLETVLQETLISKLTAQVVPPEILSDIEYHFGEFDTSSHPFEEIAHDLQRAARILRDNGLLMSHLKVDNIKFRSKFHERIAKSYLDERSGMSYGFLVWQKPMTVRRARKATAESTLRSNEIQVDLKAGSFIVDIPDVWVVSTRSGCDKTDINISRDIVRMGLVNGKIQVDTPIGMTQMSDCKPSYDTLSILSHALANYMAASILKYLYGDNEFTDSLEYVGLSLFHWHGYPDESQVPKGMYFHGSNNPAVSCSTGQSAVYSMYGKLEALSESLIDNVVYKGDVHIEPHHGSNISSTMRLEEIIEYVLSHQ